MMRFLKITCFSLLVVGCSSSEFSGGAGNVGGGLNSKKSNSPNGKNPGVDGDAIQTGEGGNAQLACDPNKVVEDPSATVNMGGRTDIVKFVNTICGPKLSNNFYGAGALHADQVTANAVCRFKGYLRGTMTKVGKYTSPHNNSIGTWQGSDPGTTGPFDPFTGALVIAVASSSNITIDGLTCHEKVQAACVPKKESIDCK